MSGGLVKYKLGDFLTRIKDGINLEDNVSYKRATIRINNKGISVRDELLGKNIKTKRQFLISEGQFLMSKIDARNGAFGIVPKELDNGIITGNFWTFNVDDSIILGEFFKNFTLAPNFIEICSRASTGSTNRKYLNEAKFLDIEIAIPSINEQRNILRKIDSIRVNYSELVKEISSQEENVKQLRQSILQDAVTGKLTKEWREQNPKVEPASELLKKIKAEKEQLIKEKKIKKEKPLPAITKEEIPFEIPESWVWCRMGSTGNAMTSSFVDGPFGSSINTKRDYMKSGVPVLRMMNVKPYRFKDDSMKYISEEKYQSFLRHNVISGDILFSKVGAGIGEACIVPDTFTYGMLSTTGISRFRVGEIIINEYLCHFINGHITLFKSLAKSSAQPFLNMTQIKSVLIPLPPLKEQNIIVQKVNQILTPCDELEQEITTSKTNAEKLMQSVLSELLGEEN